MSWCLPSELVGLYEFNSNLLPQLNKRETYFAINIISGMNAQYTVSLQLLLVDVVFCFVLFFLPL